MKTSWAAGRYAAWIYLHHLGMPNLSDFIGNNEAMILLISILLYIQKRQTAFKISIKHVKLIQILVKDYMTVFKEHIIAFKEVGFLFKDKQAAFKILMSLVKIVRNVPKVVQIGFKLRQTAFKLLQIFFKVVIMLIHLLIIHIKHKPKIVRMRIYKFGFNRLTADLEAACIKD